jgi:hypothetical protein
VVKSDLSASASGSAAARRIGILHLRQHTQLHHAFFHCQAGPDYLFGLDAHFGAKSYGG